MVDTLEGKGMITNSSREIETGDPVASPQVVMLGALIIIASTLLSIITAPYWLPGMASSMVGEAPKAFWYLSRGSAMVGFILLWTSMALGLLITNRMARLWPGGPVAFDLHQFVSLLGLGFGLFHALILLGDRFINADVFQVLVPFAGRNYRPLWVGLGQIAFYVWLLLVGSFYVRKQVGARTWRWIHFASFLVFALVLVHGVTSGTDINSLWATVIYWTAGGSILLLLFYRIMVTAGAQNPQRA
jgi:predicted ferric reductase